MITGDFYIIKCVLCVRFYRYEGSFVCFFSKNNFPVYKSEQSMVFADAHVFTWVVLCASLSHDDVARDCFLSSENLNTQPFGVRFSTVFGATNSLLMCHFI